MSLDCSAAETFDITLTGNTTLSLTGATDGLRIIVRVAQDATGGRTMAFGAMVAFSADVPSVTLSTGANKVDLIGFIYHAATNRYLVTSINRGF